MENKFLKIGHRGACGYEPENTLLSFKKALELDVDAIEFDVYTLKDGKTVIMHDDTLDRTTNGTGELMDKTFEELRELDAGKGEKIPTLQEALNTINRKAITNIELKGKGTARPVFEIIKDYVQNKAWSYDDFLISSFLVEELRNFKNLCKEIKIAFAFDQKDVDYKKTAEELSLYSINIDQKITDKETVKEAHDMGLKVLVWTVNEPEDIKKIESLGVDGIFSNYPDRL